jgi:hypothetical protein
MHVAVYGAVFYSKPPRQAAYRFAHLRGSRIGWCPCECLTCAHSAFLEPPPHILIPLVPSALFLFTSLTMLRNFLSFHFCRKHRWDRRTYTCSTIVCVSWGQLHFQWHSISMNSLHIPRKTFHEIRAKKKKSKAVPATCYRGTWRETRL